jgi:hypothetical protein
MKNYYPDLPFIPFKRTTAEMDSVIAMIKMFNVSSNIKAAMYTMFRFESLNGTKGINNNYCGIQADAARWPAEFTQFMSGVVSLKENNTNRNRLFIGFTSLVGCLTMLCDRVQKRGLFVGGTTYKITNISILNPETFALAYKCEWVTGDPGYIPTKKEINDISSTYMKGLKLFA